MVDAPGLAEVDGSDSDSEASKCASQDGAQLSYTVPASRWLIVVASCAAYYLRSLEAITRVGHVHREVREIGQQKF